MLAIIPARAGSKGLLSKNIKELLGKPLIQYTIEEALKSKFITKVVVSTEDENIANLSKKYGAEIPYIRPTELAQDSTPTIDVILHMVNYLKEKENYNPDYVCLLQCTSPLRRCEHIDGTIEKTIDVKADGGISVCEAEVNPYWTNVIENDRLKYFIEEGKNISRRQDLPPIYRINGAVYVVKTPLLMKEKTFEVEDTAAYVMDLVASIDIDNIIDFKLAEIIMKEDLK